MKHLIGLAIVGIVAVFCDGSAGAVTAYVGDAQNVLPVNLVRHFNPNGTGDLLSMAERDVAQEANISSFWTEGTPIDGSNNPWFWGASDTTNGTGVARITLDQSHWLSKFRMSLNAFYKITDYAIRVSDTGWGSMSTVVARKSWGLGDNVSSNDVLASSVQAKYVEMQWWGAPATYVGLSEFSVFPDATKESINSDQGYNLIGLPGVSIAQTAGSGEDPARIMDLDSSTYAYTWDGPATFRIDLGAKYDLYRLTLGMYRGATWASGATVQTSEDGTVWTTVLDTGAAVGSTSFTVSQIARYILLTNKATAFSGPITDFEAFGNAVPIPEPASLGLLALGGLALLRRRK